MLLHLNDKNIKSFESFSSKIRGKNRLVNFFHWNHPEQPNAVDSNGINHYSIWFENIISIWDKYIPENSIALDVGAHCGDTSIPMANLVGDEGLVLSFDPGPVYKILELNKQANPNLNIDTFNVALTEEDGEYDFVYSGGMYNGGKLTEEIKIGRWTELAKKVKGINFIKHFESKIDLSRIKFIKVDTEGYDYKILESLSEIITANRPVLYTEWWCFTELEMQRFCDKYKYRSVNPFTMQPVVLDIRYRCDDLLLLPT